jgi:hypothetical protein
MSFRRDSVYRTVQWLRAGRAGPGTFAGEFADLWAEWARVRLHDLRVKVGLINYKPFERARVMIDVIFVPGRAVSSPVTLNLFLQVFADAQAARREYDAGTRLDLRRGFGPSVFLFADHHVVGWTLPNAPNLSELHELLDAERFWRFAQRVPELSQIATARRLPTLVRYVPLKRALLVLNDLSDQRRYYIKLNAEGAAGTSLNLRELRAWHEHGAFGFTVPRVVHYAPDLQTLVMSEVPGRSFTRVMTEGRTGAFADVGHALAELHRVPAAPGRAWSPQKEHGELRRHMDGVKRALPVLGPRLDRLLDQLAARIPSGDSHYAPIHGNLFGDQILYDETAKPGRRVGIVDWDAWCHGDPHFDLARLIAHLLYLARVEGLSQAAVSEATQAFLNGYGRWRATLRSIPRRSPCMLPPPSCSTPVSP